MSDGIKMLFIFETQLLEGFSRKAIDKEFLFSYLSLYLHQVNVSSIVKCLRLQSFIIAVYRGFAYKSGYNSCGKAILFFFKD